MTDVEAVYLDLMERYGKDIAAHLAPAVAEEGWLKASLAKMQGSIDDLRAAILATNQAVRALNEEVDRLHQQQAHEGQTTATEQTPGGGDAGGQAPNDPVVAVYEAECKRQGETIRKLRAELATARNVLGDRSVELRQAWRATEEMEDERDRARKLTTLSQAALKARIEQEMRTEEQEMRTEEQQP